jgi:hypothetical protein
MQVACEWSTYAPPHHLKYHDLASINVLTSRNGCCIVASGGQSLLASTPWPDPLGPRLTLLPKIFDWSA